MQIVYPFVTPGNKGIAAVQTGGLVDAGQEDEKLHSHQFHFLSERRSLVGNKEEGVGVGGF